MPATGGGIGVSFKVETDAVIARMKALGDRYLSEMVALNRHAAVIVNDERKHTVPRISGHFSKAGYVRATARSSYVGLKNTGWRSNDYIGVQEFGGAVPRHQGKAKRKSYSVMKPHASKGGGPEGEGYYLYPALRRKERSGEIVEVYQRELTALANKYMP
jgi:hypothetical protein